MLNVVIFDPWQRSLFSRKRTPGKEPLLAGNKFHIIDKQLLIDQARRRGGSRGSIEPPLEVNNGGLKTQTVDFQLLANSGGMENKL